MLPTTTSTRLAAAAVVGELLVGQGHCRPAPGDGRGVLRARLSSLPLRETVVGASGHPGPVVDGVLWRHAQQRLR